MVFTFFKDWQVSHEFLSALAAGRNYIYGDDPVPRAYSRLQLQGFLQALYREGQNAMGEHIIQVLKQLPIIGNWALALDTFITDFMDGASLRNFESFAGGYFHTVELVLINGSSRSWETFNMTSRSIKDHNMESYVEALSSSSSHLQRYPQVEVASRKRSEPSCPAPEPSLINPWGPYICFLLVVDIYLRLPIRCGLCRKQRRP